MAANLTILCPGQGAQVVGMGKALAETSPTARQTFETANRVLGFDLAAICFGGPEQRLNQTDISQPAIYTVGVASYRHAVEKGQIDPAFVVAAAGLSLGEYTALHLAEVFDFETGLALVAARGRYMQAAAEAVPSGMVALLGADETTAHFLCEKYAGGDVLVPANFNAPGQVVVSGSVVACQRLTAAIEAGNVPGIRATVLKVAGAFHSPLMQSAADRMAEELAKANLSVPRRIVYSNVTAQPHTDPHLIRKLLVDQIIRPVRWEQTMTPLLAQTDVRFVELPPGRTLASMAKRINRKAAIENLA